METKKLYQINVFSFDGDDDFGYSAFVYADSEEEAKQLSIPYIMDEFVADGLEDEDKEVIEKLKKLPFDELIFDHLDGRIYVIYIRNPQNLNEIIDKQIHYPFP